MCDLPYCGLTAGTPNRRGLVGEETALTLPRVWSTDRRKNSLTQEASTERDQPTDESSEDSEVLNTVRKRNRELEKELKSRPTRDELEAEIRTELERENAISEQLVALGHPKGLSEFLKGRLEEDAEVSREAVALALQGIGYQVEVDGAAEQSEGREPSSQETELAGVANLSAQVRSAASGEVDPSAALAKKINAATTPQELEQAMREAGVATSYR